MRRGRRLRRSAERGYAENEVGQEETKKGNGSVHNSRRAVRLNKGLGSIRRQDRVNVEVSQRLLILVQRDTELALFELPEVCLAQAHTNVCNFMRLCEPHPLRADFLQLESDLKRLLGLLRVDLLLVHGVVLLISQIPPSTRGLVSQGSPVSNIAHLPDIFAGRTLRGGFALFILLGNFFGAQYPRSGDHDRLVRLVTRGRDVLDAADQTTVGADAAEDDVFAIQVGSGDTASSSAEAEL